MKFFLDDDRPPDDRNRLLNAVTSYASAFHSESPASQLLSLWSSLEAILPAPSGKSSRITSFARDVRSCYTRLYFVRLLGALDFDLYGLYRDTYSTIIAKAVSAREDSVSRLASMMCLPSNVSLHAEVGSMCATNPLGHQRLFELYDAGNTTKKLYGLVLAAGQKVERQLRRIYRERNRIVHRASPSENLELLIHTLNAYILIVFESLVRSSLPVKTIDDVFAEIRIMEDARARRVSRLTDNPLDDDSLDIVLGPER